MKKFIASYSGGKDSILAIHRAIEAGYEPVMLIITYNIDRGRSWFHGIPEELLKDISWSLEIPIKLVKTTGKDYAQNFKKALVEGKEMGAEICVFGDIDIEDHKKWGTTLCEEVGIKTLFPLWQEERKKLVLEFINKGYTANITVINKDMLNEKFLGEKLTESLLVEIEKDGADVCGENGEYHTFVSDGPIFKNKLHFNFSTKISENNFAIVPVLKGGKKYENSYKFFINKKCEYFPCHKIENTNGFNCLFCFCPLYLKEKCIGNYQYTEKGIKNCSSCVVPHIPENYDKIINELMK